MARTEQERKAANKIAAANYRKRNLERTRREARCRMRLKKNVKRVHRRFQDEVSAGVGSETAAFPPRHRRQGDSVGAGSEEVTDRSRASWSDFTSSLTLAAKAFHSLAQCSARLGSSQFTGSPESLFRLLTSFEDVWCRGPGVFNKPFSVGARRDTVGASDQDIDQRCDWSPFVPLESASDHEH